MNYCALVEATTVRQIIVGDLEWAADNLPGEWHDLGDNDGNVAVGWIKTADGFTPPPAPAQQPIEPDASPAEPEPAP